MTKFVGIKLDANYPLCTNVSADNQVLLAEKECLHKKEFLVWIKFRK